MSPQERALRHNHRFDSQATKEGADRRVYELSKPGVPMTMTAYINDLIKEDIRKNPKAKRK